jgi:hypothetical protein
VKISCPKCQQAIDPEGINVATNVAFCSGCNEAFTLTELIATGEVDEGELGPPPKGCWCRRDVDDWEVGATMRSKAAWFLIPFLCMWSGISLGGIFGTQIAKGQFDPSMSLFALPFLLGTVVLGGVVVVSIWGKTVLGVRNDRAEAFVGVGTIGWRRRFEWSQITHISEVTSSVNNNGRPAQVIRLEGGEKLIQIGLGVSDERRVFLLRFLRRMIVKSKH